jgi:uncharacterized DUF497 family protein
MDFEWDPAKAVQNLSRHGIRFETAALAFEDPHAALVQVRAIGREERWLLVGMVPAGSVLVVVHAIRGEGTIRIISARKATPQERMLYGNR